MGMCLSPKNEGHILIHREIPVIKDVYLNRIREGKDASPYKLGVVNGWSNYNK